MFKGKNSSGSRTNSDPETCAADSPAATIVVRESEGATTTTTARSVLSPASSWKSNHRESGPSSSSSSRLMASTSRPAAIRIEMVEPVGPSAYSLSLQANRSPLEQWKLLKNKLIRKKSSDESTMDPADRFRQTVRAAAQEEGIICRTNELKRLLQKGDKNSSLGIGDHHPSRPSLTLSTSSNRSSFEHDASCSGEATVDPLSDDGSKPQQVNHDISSPSCNKGLPDDNGSRKSSFKSLSPSPSSTSQEVTSHSSTVKWDESNTLDASVLGDAIEAFLKGLSAPTASAASPSRTTEKRVSFR